MPYYLIMLVRIIEALNRLVGRFAMYLLFVLMAVLLWGSIARVAWVPQIWTDEMAQFIMVGYFMLGGAWALQQGSAVRMDLLYSRWSLKTQAWVDVFTIFALLFYLGVLLWGGIESTQYALEFDERRRGLWRPYMAPIKIVMVIGIVMMLLQCIAFLIRDIAKIRGEEIQ